MFSSLLLCIYIYLLIYVYMSDFLHILDSLELSLFPPVGELIGKIHINSVMQIIAILWHTEVAFFLGLSSI